MKQLRYILTLSLILLLGHSLFAQDESRTERSHLRQGNSAFQEENFGDSEVAYRKAIEENQASAKGRFNLGDALFLQKRYAEAAAEFEAAAQLAPTEATKGQAYHNLGNSLLGAYAQGMQQMQEGGGQAAPQGNAPSQEEISKLLPQSIEAYKQALRQNPSDLDTKYNLAYAQRLLQQQQNQGGGGGNDENQDKQDQQDQKEQNQDQQNQDQKEQQQNQDQQDQQQQNEQNQEEQQGKDQKPPKQAQGQLSKEDIERMLETLKYKEDQLQKALQKKKVKAEKSNIEKDW